MCRFLSRLLLCFLSGALFAAAQTSIARAASCPVSLSDFSVQGLTSSGATRVYGFDVHLPDSNPVQIRVRAFSAIAAPADLTFPQFQLPQYKIALNFPFSVRKIFGWSGAPLRELQIIDVTSGSQPTLACDAPGVALGTPSESAWIRTYADPPPRSVPPSAVIEDAPRVTIVDSDFVRKQVPSYPEIAKETGQTGITVVMVDVRPDGKAHNVRVAESSQNPNLDIAAAWAATHSTFKPPTVDGRPSSRTYKIEYVFTLDSGPPGHPDTRCNAHITNAWIDGLDPDTGAQLYDLGLASNDDTISAVSITANKQTGPAASIDASPVRWVKTVDGKSYTASVAIIDSLPLADSFMIKATSAGGAPWTQCVLYPVLTWDNTDDTLEKTKFNVPTSAGPPRIALPARFFHETRPLYPAEAVTAREEGDALLIIDVSATGKPTAVHVFNSSGSWRLDNGATQAAWLSTYPKADKPAAYYAHYDFELNIPGVKYGSTP